MLGRVGPDHLELTEVHRFRNGGVRLPDGLYWDVLGLYTDVLTGLRAAAREERLAGLAIDSWAVDYGLLDAHGALVGNPRHYRDPRTDAVIDDVHAKLDPARLYAITGLQFLPFNTLYQLAAEPVLDDRRALLVPDLLGYWLTGRQVAEETNASTTGLLDARTGDWSPPLLEALGLPHGLLPDVIAAGEVLAPLTAEVGAEIGVDYALPVTTVGSHDTASAVVGVPAETDAVRLHLLRHLGPGRRGARRAGAHRGQPEGELHQRARRRRHDPLPAQRDGAVAAVGVDAHLEPARARRRAGRRAARRGRAARGWPAHRSRRPGVPAARRHARADHPRPPGCGTRSPTAVVRCILDSLAVAFAEAMADAERLSGRPVEVVHLVGGGSQNALLCQLTADAAGRPVVAGPVEATALGNVLVQARTHGVLSGDLAALRGRVRAASRLHRYEPR